MGYCYDHRNRLCCDACGNAGDTRKRTYPHRVRYAEGGSLPYCYPSALCKACYAKHKATLHKDCKEGAAQSTRQEEARAAQLAAGELELRTGWGSWHATVPEGFVGARFVNGKTEVYVLIAADAYQQHGKWLSGYPAAQPWEPHA